MIRVNSRNSCTSNVLQRRSSGCSQRRSYESTTLSAPPWQASAPRWGNTVAIPVHARAVVATSGLHDRARLVAGGVPCAAEHRWRVRADPVHWRLHCSPPWRMQPVNWPQAGALADIGPPPRSLQRSIRLDFGVARAAAWPSVDSQGASCGRVARAALATRGGCRDLRGRTRLAQLPRGPRAARRRVGRPLRRRGARLRRPAGGRRWRAERGGRH
mmetsp:Transcript_91105/g.237513  ORF Transcript_91105/g.237513 Transcript_91105/m.237513 type:complete len:215 (+) Transcript_91105:2-646(+)